MKKILSIIFLPLLLAGCVNLDFVESSSLTSAALATNPAAAVYTTDGIYSMMKDMVEFRGVISDQNTFVRRYFMMSEIKGDNICFKIFIISHCFVLPDKLIWYITFNHFNLYTTLIFTLSIIISSSSKILITFFSKHTCS